MEGKRWQKKGRKEYVRKGEDRRGYAWDISSCDRIMAHAEKDSFIVFHDDSRTNVNWAESLKLLDKYSRNYFYSKRLIKNALLRAVNRYNPTDIQFLSDLTPDQIANHLLNSEPNINSKLLNFNRLKQLKRKINQPLASVLQRCQSLAELITTDSTRFLQCSRFCCLFEVSATIVGRSAPRFVFLTHHQPWR